MHRHFFNHVIQFIFTTALTATLAACGGTDEGNAHSPSAPAADHSPTAPTCENWQFVNADNQCQAKAEQQIADFALPILSVGQSASLNVTASSGLAVVLTSQTPDVCTLNAQQLTAVKAGACAVTATQSGNDKTLAASAVTQTTTITAAAPPSCTAGQYLDDQNQCQNKAAQRIHSFTLPAMQVGDSASLNVTASSGLAVVLTSQTPDVCTISAQQLTAVKAGTCSVTATQSGNDKILAASAVTRTTTITAAAPPSCTAGQYLDDQNQCQNKTAQRIHSFTLPALQVGDSASLNITASSGLAVVLTSQTPDVCTLNAQQLTAVKAGTCTVTATQSGNDKTLAASAVTQTTTITAAAPPSCTAGQYLDDQNQCQNKAAQSIHSFTLPAMQVGDSASLNVTASSGLAVVLTSQTPDVCAISAQQLTAVKAGTCAVTATQSGNDKTLAASAVTQTTTITAAAPPSCTAGQYLDDQNQCQNKAAQSIHSFTLPTMQVGDSVSLNVTASSGLAVVLTSQTPDVCTLNAQQLTAVKAGACAVTATQSGNDKTLAASAVTQTTTITAVTSYQQASIDQSNQLYGVDNLVGRVLEFKLSNVDAALTQATVHWKIMPSGKTFTTTTGETLTFIPDDIGMLTVTAKLVLQNATLQTVTQQVQVKSMVLNPFTMPEVYRGESFHVTVEGYFPTTASAELADGTQCRAFARRWVGAKESGIALQFSIYCTPQTDGTHTLLIYPHKNIRKHALSHTFAVQNYRFATFYDTLPDVANCQAGTLKQSVRDEVVRVVNTIRALHGLSAVTYDQNSEDQTMQAALNIRANNRLSHHPAADSKCYSTEAAEGARTSNISMMSWSGSYLPPYSLKTIEEDQINFLTDVFNVTQENVGHRRWLLDPFLQKISYGLVINGSGQGGATKVIYPAAASATVARDFVAYPYGDYPAKFFNQKALLSFATFAYPNNKWANNSTNYQNAHLTVTREDGQAVTVSKQKFDNVGAGLPNNYQFFIENLAYNVRYRVQLNNVEVDGTVRDYDYRFKIVTP